LTLTLNEALRFCGERPGDGTIDGVLEVKTEGGNEVNTAYILAAMRFFIRS